LPVTDHLSLVLNNSLDIVYLEPKFLVLQLGRGISRIIEVM
jgi:hypothetical protein